MNNEAIFEEWGIFGENIAWLRKHHGISKKRMAQIMGIGVASLNKIEQGELPPRISANIFFHIHRHFNITPYDQLCKRLNA